MDEKIILISLYNQIKTLLAEGNIENITPVYPNFSAKCRFLSVCS